MRKVLLGVSALILSMTTFADNKFGIGIGTGYSNSIYKGADNKTYPMPLMDIDYGKLYIKGATVGYTVYQDDIFAASLFLNPLGGFAVDGEDLASGYDGIDDRDFQSMFGIRVDAKTGVYGIRTGLSAQGGKEGSEFKLSAFKPIYVNDKLVVVPSIHLKGYTKQFTDYYFGVTSEEANRSSSINSSYDADAGYSFGVNLSAEYSLTDNIALMSFLGIEKFSSEISDSPIVESDVLFLMGVGAKYYF